MLRFRALLLWVVMFALPLQGFAAATMALCALQQPAAVTAAANGGANAHAHADSHDHASHQQVAQAASASPDAPDAVHKCGTCSACHVTALPSAALPSALNPLPPSRLADPFDAVATVTPRALDKPPRA